MSSTDTAANKADSDNNELEDLVSSLRQAINKSDWLAQNTSTKWEAENPELAKQWREALAKTNNSTTESSSK